MAYRTKISLQVVVLGQSYTTFHVHNLQIFIIWPQCEGPLTMTVWVVICICFVAPASLLAFTSILIRKYRANEVGDISKWNRKKISLQVVVLSQYL
jgi:hypothetical protein